jgi:hypothetical protein
MQEHRVALVSISFGASPFFISRFLSLFLLGLIFEEPSE